MISDHDLYYVMIIDENLGKVPTRWAKGMLPPLEKKGFLFKETCSYNQLNVYTPTKSRTYNNVTEIYKLTDISKKIAKTMNSRRYSIARPCLENPDYVKIILTKSVSVENFNKIIKWCIMNDVGILRSSRISSYLGDTIIMYVEKEHEIFFRLKWQ